MVRNHSLPLVAVTARGFLRTPPVMPQYEVIHQDGSREVVKYRMKDSAVMRKVRLDQMSRRLDRLEDQGVIQPSQRRARWLEVKHQINRTFAHSRSLPRAA